MELWEKINKILDYYNISRTKFAKKLNIAQNTLGRYFTPEQQDKLTPYLWKILELYPDVSREWLFFGEGEMFSKNQITPKDIDNFQSRITELETELKEEHKLNRQLTTKLLIEGTPSKDTEQSSNG